MTQKMLSMAQVLEILQIKPGRLNFYLHRLRGLLEITKDSRGRLQFTEDQVEILKRHLKDTRRAARTPPYDNLDEEMIRFQERIRQVKGVRRELASLVKDIDSLLQGLEKSPLASAIISTLPLPSYQLVHPVRVFLYPFERHFRASYPEARLLVEEKTRENAILELRATLLRAYLELPPSPPEDDPEAADRWRVFHALIVPTSQTRKDR